MCTTGRASWHTPCVQCVDRVVRGTHARLPLSGSLATVEKTMLSKKRPPTFGRAVFDWSSSEKGRRRWTRAITIQTRSYSQCVCVRDEHNRSASSRFLPFPFVLSFSAFLRTSRNGEFPRSRDFFHFFFLRGTEARNERESSRKFFGFFFLSFFSPTLFLPRRCRVLETRREFDVLSVQRFPRAGETDTEQYAAPSARPCFVSLLVFVSRHVEVSSLAIWLFDVDGDLWRGECTEKPRGHADTLLCLMPWGSRTADSFHEIFRWYVVFCFCFSSSSCSIRRNTVGFDL